MARKLGGVVKGKRKTIWGERWCGFYLISIWCLNSGKWWFHMHQRVQSKSFSNSLKFQRNFLPVLKWFLNSIRAITDLLRGVESIGHLTFLLLLFTLSYISQRHLHFIDIHCRQDLNAKTIPASGELLKKLEYSHEVSININWMKLMNLLNRQAKRTFCHDLCVVWCDFFWKTLETLKNCWRVNENQRRRKKKNNEGAGIRAKRYINQANFLRCDVQDGNCYRGKWGNCLLPAAFLSPLLFLSFALHQNNTKTSSSISPV